MNERTRLLQQPAQHSRSWSQIRSLRARAMLEAGHAKAVCCLSPAAGLGEGSPEKSWYHFFQMQCVVFCVCLLSSSRLARDASDLSKNNIDDKVEDLLA